MGDYSNTRVHPEEMDYPNPKYPREGAGGSPPSFGSDTPHSYSGSMTVPAAGQGNLANQPTAAARFDLYPHIPAVGANTNHVDVTSVSHISQSEQAPPIWISEVPRQVLALTKKNMILARRNLTSTLVRTCSSAFFMLLIYLVNEGLKARYSNEAYFQNLKDASSLRKQVPGIPGCVPKSGYQTCVTFAYTPAPWNEYQPDKDYEQVQDFAQAVKDKGRTECDETGLGLCSAGACDAAGIQQVAGIQPAHKCARCCEMHRVHKIVRTIMTHNGTAKAGDTRTCSEGGPCPIEPSKVLGFETEAAMDTYLLDEVPRVCPRGVHFFVAACQRDDLHGAAKLHGQQRSWCMEEALYDLHAPHAGDSKQGHCNANNPQSRRHGLFRRYESLPSAVRASAAEYCVVRGSDRAPLSRRLRHVSLFCADCRGRE
jgi:hypothetical protein